MTTKKRYRLFDLRESGATVPATENPRVGGSIPPLATILSKSAFQSIGTSDTARLFSRKMPECHSIDRRDNQLPFGRAAHNTPYLLCKSIKPDTLFDFLCLSSIQSD